MNKQPLSSLEPASSPPATGLAPEDAVLLKRMFKAFEASFVGQEASPAVVQQLRAANRLVGRLSSPPATEGPEGLAGYQHDIGGR